VTSSWFFLSTVVDVLRVWIGSLCAG